MALTTKLPRQVLRLNLLQELRLVRPSENLDLINRHRVQPAFNNRPNSGERPGCVDDIELAHRFRVPVLADRRSGRDVVLHAVEVAEGNAAEVEDGAEGADRVSNHFGADGDASAEGLFVLPNKALELAFLSGDAVEGPDVKEAKPLDVDGTTILLGRE